MLVAARPAHDDELPDPGLGQAISAARADPLRYIPIRRGYPSGSRVSVQAMMQCSDSSVIGDEYPYYGLCITIICAFLAPSWSCCRTTRDSRAPFRYTVEYPRAKQRAARQSYKLESWSAHKVLTKG
jgi:hypothetical protein